MFHVERKKMLQLQEDSMANQVYCDNCENKIQTTMGSGCKQYKRIQPQMLDNGMKGNKINCGHFAKKQVIIDGI